MKNFLSFLTETNLVRLESQFVVSTATADLVTFTEEILKLGASI